MIKISVIIPIYNVEKYIIKCIDSLFKQEGIVQSTIQIVFVNDCSPDSSMEILQEYLDKHDSDFRFLFLNNIVNKGLAYARNYGVENACGEYVLHLDSDDYLESNALSLLLEACVLNPNVDIVVGNIYLDYGSRKEIAHLDIYKDKDDYLKHLLLRDSLVNIWGKLIKREIYISNSIKAKEGVNQGEDFSVYPVLVYYAKQIVFIPNVVYNYLQINNNSYCKAAASVLAINQIIEAQKIISSFFEKRLSANIVNASILNTLLTLIIHTNSTNYSYVMSKYRKISIFNSNLKLKQFIVLLLLKLKLYRFTFFCLKNFYKFKAK